VADAEHERRQRRMFGAAAARARRGPGFGRAGCSEGGSTGRIEIGQVILGLIRAGGRIATLIRRTLLRTWAILGT
jgi:hypothetical protein